MPIRSWHSSHRFFFVRTSNARIRNGHQLQPIEILWRRVKVIEPEKRQEPVDFLKIGITAFSHLRFTEPDVIRRWSFEGKKNFLWDWGESLLFLSTFYLVRLIFLKPLRSGRSVCSDPGLRMWRKAKIYYFPNRLSLSSVFPQIQATRSNNEQIYSPFENKTICLASKHS